MSIRSRILRTHPAVIVLSGFILAIITGTILLKLPIATRSDMISWLDALFTATSAVCVTGLIVVDTGGYFSIFGQCVILVLIQLGGLGVMTFSVALFRWLGRNLPFRHRMAIQDMFAHTPREDIFSLVRSIFLFTIACEAIGAVLLTIFWSREMPLAPAAYTAVFHSVSAFCNAGFSLFQDSMIGYRGSLLLNGTVCGMIVIGGIGFPALYELRNYRIRSGQQPGRLSIHTKTVLITTFILIASGAVMFAVLERGSGGNSGGAAGVFLPALFQSITSRTAGFNTVDIASLKDATLMMLAFLMFFGASPGSCGGGVKTTTLALLAAFTYTRLRGRRRVVLFNKSVPEETVTKSLTLVLLSVAIVFFVLFMLLIGNTWAGGAAETNPRKFMATFFEVVSAFGTVGLSMGITSTLTAWGKSWIIVLMIVGRLGVLASAYILIGPLRKRELEFSEENLMIG